MFDPAFKIFFFLVKAFKNIAQGYTTRKLGIRVDKKCVLCEKVSTDAWQKGFSFGGLTLCRHVDTISYRCIYVKLKKGYFISCWHNYLNTDTRPITNAFKLFYCDWSTAFTDAEKWKVKKKVSHEHEYIFYCWYNYFCGNILILFLTIYRVSS